MSAISVLLIGCGNMGSALVRGWSKLDNFSVHVVDPHDLTVDLKPLVSRHSRSISGIPLVPLPDIVLLAIKPQQMDDVLLALKSVIKPDTLVLSIAAGRTLSGITALLHSTQPVIRAMPNLPASVGLGITAACVSATVTSAQKEIAGRILSAAGDLIWLNDEDQIDSVTALSGSGPAYVFLLTEVMAKAGEALGLAPNIAAQLARQTVIGAATMMGQQPELPASALRQNVTSPGGTTAAALDVLMGHDALQSLMTQAVRAARDRSTELKR